MIRRTATASGASGPVVALSCALVLTSMSIGEARADGVRRSLCTRSEVTREVQLRAIAGMEDVCDVVYVKPDEGSEERTLYHAGAESGFCAERFEAFVDSLVDAGWTCSRVGRSEQRGEIPRRASAPAATDTGPFARAWWTHCTAALIERRTDPERVCGCAVEVMNEAGFEERDYEVLASPYDGTGASQPAHRAGLLYGVGMMAVDALARCEAR